MPRDCAPSEWSTSPTRSRGTSSPAKRAPSGPESVLVDGAKVTILVQHEVLRRCGEQSPGEACNSLGDGFEAAAHFEEPASGGGPSGIFANMVTLYTSDDFMISATAYNAADEKGVDPLMASPVLGQDQMEALVEDPAWLTR